MLESVPCESSGSYVPEKVSSVPSMPSQANEPHRKPDGDGDGEEPRCSSCDDGDESHRTTGDGGDEPHRTSDDGGNESSSDLSKPASSALLS